MKADVIGSTYMFCGMKQLTFTKLSSSWSFCGYLTGEKFYILGLNRPFLAEVMRMWPFLKFVITSALSISVPNGWKSSSRVTPKLYMSDWKRGEEKVLG